MVSGARVRWRLEGRVARARAKWADASLLTRYAGPVYDLWAKAEGRRKGSNPPTAPADMCIGLFSMVRLIKVSGAATTGSIFKTHET